MVNLVSMEGERERGKEQLLADSIHTGQGCNHRKDIKNTKLTKGTGCYSQLEEMTVPIPQSRRMLLQRACMCVCVCVFVCLVARANKQIIFY